MNFLVSDKTEILKDRPSARRKKKNVICTLTFPPAVVVVLFAAGVVDSIFGKIFLRHI